MNKIPVFASDLIRELDKAYPHRCIGAQEREIDAHRHAGARDLVDRLLFRLQATEADEKDPSKPLVRKP